MARKQETFGICAIFPAEVEVAGLGHVGTLRKFEGFGSLICYIISDTNESFDNKTPPQITLTARNPNLTLSLPSSTMKITKKIELAEKEDRVWWSFEYFPPRTAQVSILVLYLRGCQVDRSNSQGLQNLLDRIERMRALGPEFIDITWCVARCAMCYQTNDSHPCAGMLGEERPTLHARWSKHVRV